MDQKEFVFGRAERVAARSDQGEWTHDTAASETAKKHTRPRLTEAVTTGVMRLLQGHGFACLLEVPLNPHRRADIVGLKSSGDICIVEVKSGIEDFRADTKWPDYSAYADQFYLAFPEMARDQALDAHKAAAALAPGVGLILSDPYGGDIVIGAKPAPLSGQRRSTLTRKFAVLAARRLTHQRIAEHLSATGLGSNTERLPLRLP